MIFNKLRICAHVCEFVVAIRSLRMLIFQLN